MLVDAHCHLDRYPNPLRIVREAEEAGVTIISVTNLPSHFQQARGPVSKLRNVRPALGLHPMLAPHSESELRMFAELLPTTSFVGEVGLDFSKVSHATRASQIDSFEFVLRQISGKGKIVSLHSRKAETDVLDRLMKYGVRSAIFHWFTGDQETLDQIVSQGYFLSVNSAMVRTERGRSQLEAAPRDKILLETDGPYCTLASKPTHPRDVHDVVRKLVALWRISAKQVVNLTSENFRTALRLADDERLSRWTRSCAL